MKFKPNQVFILLVISAISIALQSCGGGSDLADYNHEVYRPVEASRFRILGADGRESTIIETLTPWQGSDSADATRLFVRRAGESVPAGFTGQVLDAPARRVAVMSSSYVAMLDAFGAVDRIVAVSGIDFISNEYIQAGRDTIVDVGYDHNIDYERLLGSRPDLVLLYGVGGANMMEPKLRELNIPFAYVGEYLEDSPLGKAEWIVPLAEALDLRHEAEARYETIDSTYRALQRVACDAGSRPSVMLNSPYRDQWMMPSNRSYAVRLIDDAGGRYIYEGNDSDSSRPIDMEEAYMLVSQADLWLTPGRIDSLDDLKAQFPRFADLPVVQRGDVWNTTLRVTPNGGNEYWETSVVHPDLVLGDLVRIFHPEALLDWNFRYYKRL